MSQSIGASISTNVTAQLKARQGIFEKKFKDEKDLKFLSSKSAWVIMRSSVDVVAPSLMANAFTNRAARVLYGDENIAKGFKLC